MKTFRSTKKQKRQHRIAMVCDFFYPRLGGVENHIYSLAQHLVQLGHKVIVITHAYDNRKGVRYLPGPLKVYHCPIVPMTDQDALPTFTATLPLLRWIWIREGIEIVHGHQATSTMANEAVTYASLLGIPCIYTDHSLFSLDDLAGVILSRVLQTTLSVADAAICVSHTCRDNLILRAHLDPKRVFVIPNAVDPSKFTPDPSQRNIKSTNSNDISARIKVIVVSRLVYRKGVDLLVGIIPRICSHLEHVDFIIGGDGSKMLDLQEMVERHRLQDRVEFLGSVPHADVRNVLCRGHVFLNCSLTESFCIAILEAASCGLLVVSTNVGGVPEVLPDDMIILSKPNVPALVQNLQRAIARCQGGDEQQNKLLDPFEAHERVKQMYSWKRVATETVEVYDRVLLQQPKRSFLDRLACYQSLGGMSGVIACLLAVTVQLWLHFIEWWQPSKYIDVVPDLAIKTSDVKQEEGSHEE